MKYFSLRECQWSQRGFTLLEAVVALLVLAIIGVSLLRGLSVSGQMTYTASLSATALYRAQEKMEEILADDFSQIETENYPSEVGLTMDTRGTINTGDDVFFDRRVTIIDESTEDHQLKRVNVAVVFRFCGETYTERMETLVAAAGR